MQTRKHIFLIGFMGCGKSYWGRHLSEKLGWPFLDLDDHISALAGHSIAHIFSTSGEAGFRALEHEALLALEHLPPTLIATGGGTPCFYEHMEWMNAHGTTLYLNLSPAELANRLQHQKETRPLLSAVKNADLEHFIAEKLEARAPFYLQAHHILTQNNAAENFAEQLEAKVKSIISPA